MWSIQFHASSVYAYFNNVRARGTARTEEICLPEMKRFNNREKDYIKRICQAKKVDSAISYLDGGLISKCLVNEGISLSWEGKGICRYRCKENGNTETVERHIEDVAILLNTLEKERYIDYYSDGSLEPVTQLERYFLSQQVSRTLEFLQTAKDMIAKDTQCYVKIDQSLYDLVNDNFMTEDDKALLEAKKQTEYALKTFEDSKRQTKYARWTFWATLVAMFFAIGKDIFETLYKAIG